MRKLLQDKPEYIPPPEVIAETFSRAIMAFDDAIAGDVLNLFGGLEGLKNFSDAEIRAIINDQHNGGVNWKRTRLCMYGTTALVALVDPDHHNLWVANLGDCQAIMVYPAKDSKEWVVDLLTHTHNGYNDAELDRIKKAHPGEPECIVDRRVLGALAPTRCLGDIPFKQPAEFTRRILYNLFPGFHDTSPWEEFLLRNRTPPYITAEPEVIHRRLDEGDFSALHPRYLILASDGFTDLCEDEGQRKIVDSWAGASYSNDRVPDTPNGSKDNLALRLLRRALGPDDLTVSRTLTLDMDTAWIDDTSIIVQLL
jgi:pyruvate dehydrogenase phosphatase